MRPCSSSSSSSSSFTLSSQGDAIHKTNKKPLTYANATCLGDQDTHKAKNLAKYTTYTTNCCETRRNIQKKHRNEKLEENTPDVLFHLQMFLLQNRGGSTSKANKSVLRKRSHN
jgi:hypothetical protein